jgi:YidC/Oxa1 family membrane protein insertase
MDKRTTLALALTALVMIAPMFLFSRRAPVPAATADSTGTGPGAAPIAGGGAPAASPSTPAPGTPVPAPSVSAGAPGRTTPDSVTLARVDSFHLVRPGAKLTFVAPFASPATIELPGYRDLSAKRGSQVSISQYGGAMPILRYRVVLGSDTVPLAQLAPVGQVVGDTVRFQATSPEPLTIEYRPSAKEYVTRVSGTLPARATALLIDLPEALESFEADTLDDQKHRAFGHKPMADAITSISLSSLDSTKFRTDLGPLQWVAARTKYFMLAIVADSSQPIESLRMRGGTHVAKGVAIAYGTATLPIKNGQFAFDLYTGPQSWTHLRAVGYELENVNPYGGWAHSMAQPFVEIVMRLLLWLKAAMGTNYGWVLVVFGVMVRLLMWPLNQSAMRSSLKLQRLQPEMEAVKKRFPTDREAQQRAIMKVYQDHGMNPLTPLLGCLPMLLPMPVLFALYFVFQNTIEFRGVPFLWLPDLSIRDPFFITPVFMGISMFFLSWLGMRNAPPNPQAKVMAYMMPAFMVFLFLNFPSGLNLYYGVQNMVAIPQQWILTRERLKKSG